MLPNMCYYLVRFHDKKVMVLIVDQVSVKSKRTLMNNNAHHHHNDLMHYDSHIPYIHYNTNKHLP